MIICQYCTPEWLKESFKIYHSGNEFQEKLKKLSVKVFFRIKEDTAWGIDKDILFGAFVDAGNMKRLNFFSEEEAKTEADFILSATPKEWKRILRKESKFITDFMVGKIKLEMGSKVGILGLAPHANTLVDSLTQVELQFPDEMSVEEFGKYQAHMAEFRAEMGV